MGETDGEFIDDLILSYRVRYARHLHIRREGFADEVVAIKGVHAAAADAERMDLVGWAQNHGVSELAVPRRIVFADAIPVLGTGKTDYGEVRKIVVGSIQDTA